MIAYECKDQHDAGCGTHYRIGNGRPAHPVRDPRGILSAFNSGDLELMTANWLASDEVAMDNPLGGIKRGWPEIRSVYENIFQSRARVRVEFWDYTLHKAETFFYAVGRERGRLSAGDLELDLAIRTTRLFRHDGDRWRQVHHHGSIDDPDLLRRYQNAVKRRTASNRDSVAGTSRLVFGSSDADRTSDRS